MNLQTFLSAVVHDGGASYSFNTGELNPKRGYFVSIAGVEKILPGTENLRKEAAAYIRDNSELLYKEAVYLGGWTNEGKIYLDCSERIDDLREAIMTGMGRNQLAIFDAVRGVSIELPEPQTHGTDHQAQTYADMKARQIIESLKV
jgi:hypothetical protein